jgi:AraC family transcriptional regulator
MMSGEYGATRALADDPYFTRPEELDESRAISSLNFAKGDLSVARYRRRRPGLGLTEPNPIVPVFMAVVTLDALPRHGGWRDGRAVDIPDLEAGALSCLDLRERWIFDMPHPFHTFHAFIPIRAFDEFSRDAGVSQVERLYCPNTVETRDPTMLGLAQAIHPLLEEPDEVTPLFADHIFAAIVAHLALTYGGSNSRPPKRMDLRRRRVLTPFQERRVTNFLLQDLKVNFGLPELASLCGLSRSHFASAFRQTMGVPPHRWLLMKRVNRAKELLYKTQVPVSQIAAECGFADQAHLTRVFKKAFGVGPAGWRRDRQE